MERWVTFKLVMDRKSFSNPFVLMTRIRGDEGGLLRGSERSRNKTEVRHLSPPVGHSAPLQSFRFFWVSSSSPTKSIVSSGVCSQGSLWCVGGDVSPTSHPPTGPGGQSTPFVLVRTHPYRFTPLRHTPRTVKDGPNRHNTPDVKSSG